jgi:hypothetical protein
MREPICGPCALAACEDEPIFSHECVGRLGILPLDDSDGLVTTWCACECQDEREAGQ